jgi:hypothetical protein
MKTMFAALAALLSASLAPALAADQVKVRIANPTALEYIVEIRDMVCDGKVLWAGRMKAGKDKVLRACAGEDGYAIIATVSASGCASARTTLHEAVAAGDEIVVAEAEAEE